MRHQIQQSLSLRARRDKSERELYVTLPSPACSKSSFPTGCRILQNFILRSHGIDAQQKWLDLDERIWTGPLALIPQHPIQVVSYDGLSKFCFQRVLGNTSFQYHVTPAETQHHQQEDERLANCVCYISLGTVDELAFSSGFTLVWNCLSFERVPSEESVASDQSSFAPALRIVNMSG